MHLDLTDDEAAALLRELDGLIDGDRYFMSRRIKTLKAIGAKIRPEPLREPLPPPPKQYAPPRAGRRHQHGGDPALRIRGGHPAQWRASAGSHHTAAREDRELGVALVTGSLAGTTMLLSFSPAMHGESSNGGPGTIN
jgi:hypothetical protein